MPLIEKWRLHLDLLLAENGIGHKYPRSLRIDLSFTAASPWQILLLELRDSARALRPYRCGAIGQTLWSTSQTEEIGDTRITSK